MKSVSALSLAALASATPTVVPDDHLIHTVVPPSQFVLLSDVVPTSKSIGWDGYWTDRSTYQKGFIIDGVNFASGVFAGTPSLVKYDLEMKYASFSGSVGLEDGDNLAATPDNQSPHATIANCQSGITYEIIGTKSDGTSTTLAQGSYTPGDAAVAFDVNVRNYRHLELKADSANPDVATDCTHVAWVNTKLYEDPIIDCMQLDTMTPNVESHNWGNYWTQRTWTEEGFLVAGTTYSNGVYAGIHSHLQYNVDAYHTFEACVGVDDHITGATCATAQADFRAAAIDGGSETSVVQKQGLTKGDAVQCLDLDIKDAQHLDLDVSGASDCSHADWVNAKVCKATPRTSVDCELSSWSAWSGCSASCGTGYETRHRTILTQPTGGGKHCSHADLAEDGDVGQDTVRTCNTASCPVDCEVDTWDTHAVTVTPLHQSSNFGLHHVLAHKIHHGEVTSDLSAFTDSDDAHYRLASWSACKRDGVEVTCGGGTRERTRAVTRPAMHGGIPCPHTKEVEACMTMECPVPCEYTDWSQPHAACSVSCGPGKQTESRSVTKMPEYGGAACPALTRQVDCTVMTNCPVDCQAQAFPEQWQPCTHVCGGGTQSKTRQVIVGAAAGGAACPDLTRTRECNNHPCAINCQTSTPVAILHGDGNACSVSCGPGVQTTHMSIIVDAAYGGTACPTLTQESPCDSSTPGWTAVCPIDCTFSAFGPYTECSASCGGGKQWRGRTILNDGAFHGGKGCPHTEEERPCNTHECPVDCEVVSYGDWGSCSVSCNGGTMKRMRSVVGSGAQYGGKACPTLEETRACGADHCPVDCAMSEWIDDPAGCDRTCGTGHITSTRTIGVGGEYGRYGGIPCGPRTKTTVCNTQECNVDCEYSAYSPLNIDDATCITDITGPSGSCGAGKKYQMRSITRTAKHDGTPCDTSSLKLEKDCSIAGVACPTECEMTAWSDWSDCSKTCGSKGSTYRMRTVKVQPSSNAAPCPVSTTDFKDCGSSDPAHADYVACPTDCTIGDWSAFGSCSKDCKASEGDAAGEKTRTRSVTGSACGDVASSETKDCNDVLCQTDCTEGSWTPTDDSASCSATCGNGWLKQTRTLTQPVQNGQACGASVRYIACNADVNCAAPCEYSTWSSQGHVCSVTCGTGHILQTRSIIRDADHGATPCDDSASSLTTQTIECALAACPVDCQPFPWAHSGDSSASTTGAGEEDGWSACDKTCTPAGGSPGQQHRSRGIEINQFGTGAHCASEDLTQTRTCKDVPCPVDCVLESAFTYTDCSRSCVATNAGSADDKGFRTGTKAILTAPQHGGTPCGPTIDMQECTADPCPIDCHETWPAWPPCPVTCGGYTQTRTSVVHQEPIHTDFGAAPCVNTQTQVCGNDPAVCPVDCIPDPWGHGGVAGAWSACPACGGGMKSQTRTFTAAVGAGSDAPCSQVYREVACTEEESPACAVDCTYTPYEPLDADMGSVPCSKSCEGGTKVQYRSISIQAQHGGAACDLSTLVKETSCNTDVVCPVDCQYGPWTLYTPCSKSCTDGGVDNYQQRQRGLIQRVGNGALCETAGVTEVDGTLIQSHQRLCNTNPCPVDCEWSAWGHNGVEAAWSDCSHSCDGGTKTQTRSQIGSGAQHGGAACTGDTIRTDSCNEQGCPINCAVSGWSVEWGDCTVGCGGGTRYKYRTVTTAPQNGGEACPELREADSVACNDHTCPVHCVVGNWENWGSCSRSCGNGIMLRQRAVTPGDDANACPVTQEARVCNIHNCPVDCIPTPWTDPTPCSKSCGEGYFTQWRQISQPALWGGEGCGVMTNVTFCNSQACPTDCVESEWSDYGAFNTEGAGDKFGAFGACSASCGGGTQMRTRTVVAPENGGKVCGPTKETRDCNMHDCPVHCEYVGATVDQPTGWGYEGVLGDYSPCTKTCGGGTMRQTRAIHVLPYAGGEQCGELVRTVPCSPNPCPVHCTVTEWSDWGVCSTSCGGGKRTRHRNIHTHAAHGGFACPALDEEDTACAPKPCPQDCELNDWQGWTGCSVTCGGGKKSNTRTVKVAPLYGGRACGALVNWHGCSSHPCPINCAFGDWTPYSACSVSCTIRPANQENVLTNPAGHKTRSLRVLREAAYGGTCSVTAADRTETAPCGDKTCPVHCQVSAWDTPTACDVTCATVYQRVTEGSQLAQYGWQTRSRTITVQPTSDGHGCPALTENMRCNQYHDCMTMFVSGESATAAPDAVGTHLDTLTHGPLANAQQLTAGSGTAAPTAAPTKSVFGGGSTCDNGGTSVLDGWHGAGAGSNYCNLCKCTNGVLSCQKKNCAAPTKGLTCSHVTCAMKYSYSDRANILMVSSHHLEENGAEHSCKYNLHPEGDDYNSGTCSCNCYDSGFALEGLSGMTHHVSE